MPKRRTPVAAVKKRGLKRIRIKQATARNLLALNRAITAGQQELKALEQRMEDNLRSIYTERCIEEGAEATHVSDRAPFYLTVRIQ